MRKEFAEAILNLALEDDRVVFLTGDLGFQALETLQSRLGPRFLNMGIAEQNMVSFAAGLASQGFTPWLYSIAPFAVFRPYEQIRNDVCLHRLPVKIVGNGGGFGYGIMGATHHALEDVGAMRMLPAMRVAIPTFSSDVGEAVRGLQAYPGPGYLRLNLALDGSPDESYRPWRHLVRGEKAVVLALGPAAKGVLDLLPRFPEATFDVICAGELPYAQLPASVLKRIEGARRVVVLEEHVESGGLGEWAARELLTRVHVPISFLSIAATGYPSGNYGSQRWHQEENGLCGEPLYRRLQDFLREQHA